MSMKCPVCLNNLTEIQAGDVNVDVCKGGCGGVWLDEFEIKKFDEPHEFAGELIVNVERDPAIKIDHDAIRCCPRCSDEAMCKRYYDINRQVEVDQCLRCSGIWLDVGELATIRSQFKTEAERQQAADSYLDNELQRTNSELKQDTAEYLAEWDEQTSLRGLLRGLFRGVIGNAK